ncbi:MAG TPA: serine/threonine-protein kinase [Thermoanaerobaculia bacterium]|nr:serine/threonine-protein kinase [Thermoanaerobaculia bacterium]
MSPDPADTTRTDRAGGAGRRLGRFETVRLLGRGGMGSVYLAEDRVIGRQVAIKEIRIEQGVSEAALAEARVRFEVELRAAGRLSHPHIATVYDAFETGDSYCIALEYVPGISLDERLRDGPPLRLEEIAKIAGEIASGLDYAHRRGIVHRDVKPGNVLLSEEGGVKITDFGIAKLASLDVTQTGVALGTPAYMSPEQIQGKPLDGRSDQFSLGVLLYRMLTGKLPFDGANAHTMLYQVLQAEPERPGAVNPALPPALDRVLAKALAKEPGGALCHLRRAGPGTERSAGAVLAGGARRDDCRALRELAAAGPERPPLGARVSRSHRGPDPGCIFSLHLHPGLGASFSATANHSRSSRDSPFPTGPGGDTPARGSAADSIPGGEWNTQAADGQPRSGRSGDHQRAGELPRHHRRP